MISFLKAAVLLLCSFQSVASLAATWYVRPDGGTRYSSNVLTGQCDGLTDASYASTGGKGVNKHCAFKDYRSIYQDGSYNNMTSFPAWGWVIKGGDTVIIRGSIGTDVSYRVGYGGPTSPCDANGVCGGVWGNPYVNGNPPIPSGTAGKPTRILGENYASCSAPAAKTQLHGGYGTTAVLDMGGASYVDVECLDITDFSKCSVEQGTRFPCQKSPPMDDFAKVGISWTNTSTFDTLNNVTIHGLAGGMLGPTGDGVVMTNLDIHGNSDAGWNSDNGSVGVGSVLVQNFNISWNGCAEEYPIVHPLPYYECLDDSSGGYGDGFGTATIKGTVPWNVTFDHGTVSYNTQDGLDALHLVGAGSSMTITHVTAFGNEGQQIKVGGTHGVAKDNLITTNCNALRFPIPGAPVDYSSKLADVCRAADTGILLTIGKGSTTVFENNIVYSASTTGIEIECDGNNGACDNTALIHFRNNVFIGFKNDAAHGYPGGGRGEYSTPIYLGAEINPFTNPGSMYSGNTTFHAGGNWKCPARGEKDAHCGDPHLVDEVWHNYGHADMSPAPAGTPSVGEKLEPERSVSLAHSLPSVSSHIRLRTVACLCAGALGVAAWQGLRSRQDR